MPTDNTLPKPKRRTNGRPPQNFVTDATKDDISDTLNNLIHWSNSEPVKTDEECAQRLNDFFVYCAKNGEIPTVEKMCLALGSYRQAVWKWEQGEMGPLRRDIIKKAKQLLASFDAELVATGRMNVVAYVFRAKNYYGMRDQVEVTSDVTQERELTDEEIMKSIVRREQKKGEQ